jgi:peptidoglycan/xylan/chitin deacetylase (PgdA/CDA1 family)
MTPRNAYLTIDDSPSARTDDMVDALCARGVPAILYCRGDLMAQNMAPIIRAIQKGFVIGNHGYWHTRASTMTFEQICESIKKTDDLINDAYAQAGVKRPGKYYRFAYLDRGMGAWFVEPEKLEPVYKTTLTHLIQTGLGNNPNFFPTLQQIDHKDKIQNFLRDLGYTQTPFQNITLPFYAHTEMAQSIDAMFTYSTSDWAITDRHKGKFGFSNVQDLKNAFDSCPHMARTDSNHIILAHDQAELYDVLIDLIDHMLAQGIHFKGV